MPDPNLDRLKAVSEAARRVYDAPKPLGIYQDIYTMFDDLLRLAECKDDVKAALEERDVVDDDHALLDRIQLIVSYRDPAAPKDDDEKH